MSVEAIAEAIAADCGVSEYEPEVCAGIIGEIGISKDFTLSEEKVLRGRRARLEDQRRAPDRFICRAGSGSPTACWTSSRARAPTRGTLCSAI